MKKNFTCIRRLAVQPAIKSWWRYLDVILLINLSLTTASFAQTKVWDKTYGGDNPDNLTAMVATPDGGYLLGHSFSGASDDKSQANKGQEDYWIVKNTYPNPFQEKATIRFTLPQTQPATVKVYDSQGREITTLFQGEVKANQAYEVEWRAGK